MEERTKILKMLEEGIITAQEAEELFRTMEEKKRVCRRKFLKKKS